MKKNFSIGLAAGLLVFVLSLPVQSTAAIIFSDDFSDGNTAGWTFYGTNSGFWSESSGILNHNAASGYTGEIEFALIDGITTPDQFTLEADVSIVSSIHGSDWGHVGFVWGVTDFNEPFQSFNTSYLRTHQDRVTNWSDLDGSSPGEQFLDIPGATNGITYHLSADVDYLLRSMTVNINDLYSATFSGADFDKINQNTGGGIGFISWNDNITFDNIVLSTPNPVPVPTALFLLGSGLCGLLGLKRSRKKIATRFEMGSRSEMGSDPVLPFIQMEE